MKNLQLKYSIFATGQGTKTERQTLKEIGISKDQFYDDKGHLKSSMQISKMINQAIKDSGANTANTIIKLFGKESGPTALPLFLIAV